MRPPNAIGLIAQEVEEVFPDWVDEEPDGYRRVTVRGSTALFVEALRELRAEKGRQLAERDAQIAALTARLEALERRAGLPDTSSAVSSLN